MSIEGVEKLLEEMCGGRPPISSFGERLKEELAGVSMTESGEAVEGTPEEDDQEDAPEDAPAEPETEPEGAEGEAGGEKQEGEEE